MANLDRSISPFLKAFSWLLFASAVWSARAQDCGPGTDRPVAHAEKARPGILEKEKCAPENRIPPNRVPPSPLPAAEIDGLLEKGRALERTDVKAAVPIYVKAARGGSGQAAARLAQIFDKGKGNVPRDFAEMMTWKTKAEELGVDTGLKNRGR